MLVVGLGVGGAGVAGEDDDGAVAEEDPAVRAVPSTDALVATPQKIAVVMPRCFSSSQ